MRVLSGSISFVSVHFVWSLDIIRIISLQQYETSRNFFYADIPMAKLMDEKKTKKKKKKKKIESYFSPEMASYKHF